MRAASDGQGRTGYEILRPPRNASSNGHNPEDRDPILMQHAKALGADYGGLCPRNMVRKRCGIVEAALEWESTVSPS